MHLTWYFCFFVIGGLSTFFDRWFIKSCRAVQRNGPGESRVFRGTQMASSTAHWIEAEATRRKRTRKGLPCSKPKRSESGAWPPLYTTVTACTHNQAPLWSMLWGDLECGAFMVSVCRYVSAVFYLGGIYSFLMISADTTVLPQTKNEIVTRSWHLHVALMLRMCGALPLWPSFVLRYGR